ncbi:MAG: DNA polymerase/3'-5' exonuclease PolX [Candidatus Palauibacterales bacterium]|nr:DNA polymerase/3'-5' exonuclease PolX [Candidatus Palauibacterales bacterium]MDP2530085.1 DNA polymerase/3'-5' exonuclease PolX [Candidatus Palauibacterales bacterium]MDP2584553.1 DNA polymerase/3'-5' exonuclease PolX [Candidatus Palauibacterales bacterium]
MENVEIARTLEDVADLLEIQGSNPFRVRAYRNAARTVEEHPVPMRKLVEEGADLTELSGIGEDMSKYIHQLVDTGSLELLDQLTEDVPDSLIEIGRLPGVGPKKTQKLWKELGIETVDQLEEAAKAGKVRELEGFGAKSEEKILRGIEAYRRHQARFKISEADQHVLPLLEWLREDDSVERIEVAGSYRRRKETVGDIDLLAIAEEGGSLMKRFTSYDRIEEVLASGDTKGSVRLASGLQVDLRILTAKSYGAALVYFTGSKEHNVRLRQRAIDRGLRISEYGVFKVEKGKRGKDEDEEAKERDPWEGELVAGATEEGVYAAVGLPWIPPELREDRGEIQAAETGDLPELITIEDLRGDLQMHSTWSDGRESIEAMLEGCAERGYEYFALTDHSQSLAMTGGMDEKKLRRQWKEMDEVVAKHDEIHLFRSMEIDILADGTLDLSDEMLEKLDIVLVSIHSRFNLPADEQTDRLLSALDHPEVDILAHPTGRLINERDPYEFDLDAVLERAAERGVAVELNAHPDRLDLKDTHLLKAKALGLPIVIDTDSHRTQDLDLVRYGIDQARRAWLTREDVLNTRSLGDLQAWLDAPREERAKHWRELSKGARKKKSRGAAAAKRAKKKSSTANEADAKAKKSGGP